MPERIAATVARNARSGAAIRAWRLTQARPLAAGSALGDDDHRAEAHEPPMEVARAVESTADEEGLVVPVGTGSQLAGRRADVEVEGARASIATSKAFAMLGGSCRSFTRSEPTRAASVGAPRSRVTSRLKVGAPR